MTHFILIDHADKVGAATAALLLCQGLFIGGLIGARVGKPFRLAAMGAAMTASVVLALFHLRSGLVLSSGAPHAVIYLGLLAIFGLSLFPDREPVVTYFARMIHGGLAPEIETYTRRVTWIWCVFFALQLAGSALLLMLAPIAWWSTFVNILNVPLIAAMMLGERLTRPLWVSNPPREYLSDMLRMPQLLRQRLKKPGVQTL
ncbi:MAG TPA: hypothetical protein VH722_13230 [Alphaproteobacteria bacterium]|nr:hypothetical protein [Alphaproteobacteria bacterium]